jgi:LysM domain
VTSIHFLRLEPSMNGRAAARQPAPVDRGVGCRILKPVPLVLALCLHLASGPVARAQTQAPAAADKPAAATSRAVLPQWRDTAQRVAQAGVPLDALAPNAPDSHTVKPGDTLWGISTLFLKSAWRWPELWGMNLDSIRNPHLIYPGQVLVLERSEGRARLRVAGADGGTVRLSPRVRAESLDNGPIASIPLHLIGPFLNEAVVFNTNELDSAPRIVATQEGRVMVSRGETAYARGDLSGSRQWRVFRELKPLRDPVTQEVLGHEGRYVGTAEVTSLERAPSEASGNRVVPASLRMASVRLEAGVGDRLAPTGESNLESFVPRAPGKDLEGHIIAIYGDGVRAGQNQVVSLNKGARDGLERGHVLALWRAGRTAVDTTQPKVRQAMQLPDERHGQLFVFRVFDRVSYALVLTVQDPVQSGDRFTQP